MEAYTVGRRGESADVRQVVVSTVVDAVWPRISSALISAYADADLGELPPDAETARRRLTGGTGYRARTQSVRLVMEDPQDAETLRSYASWSSLVQLEDEQGEQVASLMDGWPVSVMLTPGEAEALAMRLGSAAEVVPAGNALRELRAERRRALRRLLPFGGRRSR